MRGYADGDAAKYGNERPRAALYEVCRRRYALDKKATAMAADVTPVQAALA